MPQDRVSTAHISAHQCMAGMGVLGGGLVGLGRLDNAGEGGKGEGGDWGGPVKRNGRNGR